MKATLATIGVVVTLAVLAGLVWYLPPSPSQARAAARIAAAEANLVEQKAALEAQQAAQERARDERANQRWESYQQAYIEPAWAAFNAGVGVAGLVVAGALALAVVGLVVVGADAWMLRRRKAALVWPDQYGRLPVEVGKIRELTATAVAILESEARTNQARALLPMLPSRREASQVIDATPTREEEAPEVDPGALPGRVDLAEVVTGPVDLSSILLALGPGGQRITVNARALCHVAIAGATDGGKSGIMRLLLAQLLAGGAKVCLADPHFTPFDAESGDDWRPIANRLHLAPAVKAGELEDLLRWLAMDEMPQRLERRRAGQSIGAPLYLAFDELPAIVADVPKAPDYLARVLREGRKANVLLIGAAQDWLVKTVGGSGAVRDNYRTAFYVGGDGHTARTLLDIAGRVDDGTLGKGVAMLRSAATPQATTVRIPYASNAALARLLPMRPAPSAPSLQGNAPTIDSVFGPGSEVVIEGASEGGDGPALDARAAQIRAALERGDSSSAIIKQVWGVTGGAAYQKASEEYHAILRKLIFGGAT